MSNASGDDEELKEALREYRRAIIDADHCYGEGNESELLSTEAGAEAALESLFGRIKEERDRLIEDAKYAQADIEALKAQHNGWQKLAKGWQHETDIRDRQILESSAELGRIREAALTPEEAKALLPLIVRAPNEYPAQIIAIEKLKFVSGGALKEGATQ